MCPKGYLHMTRHKYLCTEGLHTWFASDNDNLPCPKCFATLQSQLTRARAENRRLREAIKAVLAIVEKHLVSSSNPVFSNDSRNYTSAKDRLE